VESFGRLLVDEPVNQENYKHLFINKVIIIITTILIVIDNVAGCLAREPGKLRATPPINTILIPLLISILNVIIIATRQVGEPGNPRAPYPLPLSYPWESDRFVQLVVSITNIFNNIVITITNIVTTITKIVIIIIKIVIIITIIITSTTRFCTQYLPI